MSLIHWIADHVDTESGCIIVKDKFIPLSTHTVQCVLGIPSSGRKNEWTDADTGRQAFLDKIGKSCLLSITSFGDSLLQDQSMSDEDVIWNFMVVALGTFLCPNLTEFPSSEYLIPLVDAVKCRQWNWCEFVHQWLMMQIRKYSDLKKKAEHCFIGVGGCLYLLCVSGLL